MDHSKDLYPSRRSHPIEMFPRLDPVLHGKPGQRRDGPLTDAELARFERDGFLFYEGFFSAEEIGAWVQELRRLCYDPELRDQKGVIREPQSDEVRSIFAVHKLSAVFEHLCRDPRLLDRAQQLLDSEVTIHQSRINYKPGFKGKGFNWHSDFETWHAEDGMPRMRAVSCSVILTDNDEFNGPLMLIPGSHHYFVPCLGATPDDNYKRSLRDQQVGVPDDEALAELIELGGIQAPKGAAGSVLFFECNTLHGSNANMSPCPRSNVFFVYNSVHNRLQQPYAAQRPRPEFLGDRAAEVLYPA